MGQTCCGDGKKENEAEGGTDYPEHQFEMKGFQNNNNVPNNVEQPRGHVIEDRADNFAAYNILPENAENINHFPELPESVENIV